MQTSNPGVVSPGQVGKLGIHRAGDHLSVNGLELMQAVAEGDDLSGTHKRAVEQHNPVRIIITRLIQCLFTSTKNSTCALFYT